MSAANRGKTAEEKVTAFLKTYGERHQDFDWARNYDAHSAGGRFQRQTGDFQFYKPGLHGVIEAKEVAHDFRLPHKNFEKEKVAKIWKRELAGAAVFVVVYHSTTGLWRLPPFTFFRLARTGGSWDLTPWPTFKSCIEALDSTRLFP